MVKFIKVDPAEIDTNRLGRRGRVSYPLLKSFMEANIKMAKLDLTGYEGNPINIRSATTYYIKAHSLPIKIFSAGGDMYLMRLDFDSNGKPIENWQEEAASEGALGKERGVAAVPLNAAEVDKRFNKEAHKTTK